MAAAADAEYALRTRASADRRPLTLLSNRERGLRAASEVLKGAVSPHSARVQYMVDKDSLHYYKKKLLAQGYDELVAASAPAPASVPSTGEEGTGDKAAAKKIAAKTDAWKEYGEAYKYAGSLVAKHGRRKAAAMATEKYSVHISPSTALRASQHLGQLPSKPGRQLILGDVVESRIETLVLCLREMRIPVFQAMVLNYCNKLIAGTEMEALFKHKEVRKHWYYHWLGRCERLKTGNIRPLELTRAKWSTPDNAKRHYEMLADIFVDLGLAVRNPTFDAEVKMSEPVIITKPGRIFSMDETRLTNDTMEKHKGKGCRSILGVEGDDGTTVVNKGGGDGTAIGGSSADGLDLPAFIIFAQNIIHAGAGDGDVAADAHPTCRRADPDNPGKPLPCRFWANAKGGVTGDLGIRYIKGCVQPCLPDLSPDNPAVLIMDGHGSHFTLELLLHCREVGLHIVLRPPHTTHILQGEDVEHFAVFKPRYQQAKLLAIGRKVAMGSCRLTAGDLLKCAKEPWEHAFDLKHTLQAWDKIGVSPFTRKVYWDLVAATEQRKAVAHEAKIDPELLTVSGMVKCIFGITGGDLPAAALPPAARPLPEKRDRSANLHSCDLWSCEGGATGDECFAIVEKKTKAMLAKKRKVAEGKQQRADARKDRQKNANLLGAKICSELKSEADINKLKVDEIKAALAFLHVEWEKTAKKADVVQLLSLEMRQGSVAQAAASSAGPSAACMPEEVVNVEAASESDGEEGDGEESDWPHSEADDH